MADLMDYGRYTPHNAMGGYGGMGGGSENPVAGFMQGYSFVDNLQRQQAADAEAQKTNALRDQLLQGQVDDLNNQKQINSNYAVMTAMTHDPSGWWNNFDDATLQKTLSGLANHPEYGYLATPDGRNQFKTGYNKIMSSMPNLQNGGTFDIQGITDGLNQALGPQINKGTGANNSTDVQKKEIAGIVPAPNPGQFYFTVKTTYNDGTSDIAPLTVYRSGDPNDVARPYTVEQVLDPLRRNAAIVNYLDSQNARLGDKGAISRIQAQGQNQDLVNQINQIDPSLSPADRQQAIVKAALQNNRSPGEAIALGANMAANPKDRALDDAAKAIQVFDHSIGSVYDNPDRAEMLADQLRPYSKVLADQLDVASRIKDPAQYNAAIDNARIKRESLTQQAQWNQPSYHEFGNQGGGTTVFSQTPKQALNGQEPREVGGLGKNPPPIMSDMTYPAALKRQTELTNLITKEDKSGILNDPRMKAALQQRADAGDEGAKKALAGSNDQDATAAHKQALADELRYVQGQIQLHQQETAQAPKNNGSNVRPTPNQNQGMMFQDKNGNQRYFGPR
jgi:hypothetical protein